MACLVLASRLRYRTFMSSTNGSTTAPRAMRSWRREMLLVASRWCHDTVSNRTALQVVWLQVACVKAPAAAGIRSDRRAVRWLGWVLPALSRARGYHRRE